MILYLIKATEIIGQGEERRRALDISNWDTGYRPENSQRVNVINLVQFDRVKAFENRKQKINNSNKKKKKIGKIIGQKRSFSKPICGMWSLRIQYRFIGQYYISFSDLENYQGMTHKDKNVVAAEKGNFHFLYTKTFYWSSFFFNRKKERKVIYLFFSV